MHENQYLLAYSTRQASPGTNIGFVALSAHTDAEAVAAARLMWAAMQSVRNVFFERLVDVRSGQNVVVDMNDFPPPRLPEFLLPTTMIVPRPRQP